jgi:hypothetical protein
MKIANNFPGRLAVVSAPFLRADYVFAFPLGSAIRKQVNRSILSYIDSPLGKPTHRRNPTAAAIA